MAILKTWNFNELERDLKFYYLPLMIILYVVLLLCYRFYCIQLYRRFLERSVITMPNAVPWSQLLWVFCKEIVRHKYSWFNCEVIVTPDTAQKVPVFRVFLVRTFRTILSECGKIRTRKTLNALTFYEVWHAMFFLFSAFSSKFLVKLVEYLKGRKIVKSLKAC